MKSVRVAAIRGSGERHGGKEEAAWETERGKKHADAGLGL